MPRGRDLARVCTSVPSSSRGRLFRGYRVEPEHPQYEDSWATQGAAKRDCRKTARPAGLDPATSFFVALRSAKPEEAARLRNCECGNQDGIWNVCVCSDISHRP